MRSPISVEPLIAAGVIIVDVVVVIIVDVVVIIVDVVVDVAVDVAIAPAIALVIIAVARPRRLSGTVSSPSAGPASPRPTHRPRERRTTTLSALVVVSSHGVSAQDVDVPSIHARAPEGRERTTIVRSPAESTSVGFCSGGSGCGSTCGSG